MESFGLGLILNFTDNASSGLRNAADSLRELNGLADSFEKSGEGAISTMQALNIAGMGLSQVGGQLSSLGGAVSNFFQGMIQQSIAAGSTVMSNMRTLESLYKSSDEARKAFEWVKDFAQTSVFNFSDLLPALTMMKAVGIDVRKDITATTGETQNLLLYAGDLAAVFPDMRNMYGTGIEAAMGALKEYISEGNKVSLQRGAGLDILQILGEEKGKTIEERSRQVADLITKMGIFGMTARLAGTASQRLSNMEDIWETFKMNIADAGVFEQYNKLVAIFTDYVMNIPAEELNGLAKTVADVLLTLMRPLETVLSLLLDFVDVVRDMNKAHPTLTKTIILLASMAGTALFAGGKLLSLSGSLLMFAGALGTITEAARGGTYVMSLLRMAVSGVVSATIPLILAAGLIYLAWTNNFLGLRDFIIDVVQDIGTVLALVFDALADNTLSMDAFNRANELGLLPFLENLMILKYNLGFLIDGLKEGFTSVLESVLGVLQVFQDWGIDVFYLTQLVGDLLGVITGIGSENTWKELGTIIGQILAVALLLAVPLKYAFSIFVGILRIVFVIGRFVSTIMPIIRTVFTIVTWIWRGFTLIATVIAALTGASVALVMGIMAAVIAVAAAIYYYWDEINAFFSNVIDGISNSINEAVTAVSNFISEMFNTLRNTATEFFNWIGEKLDIILNSFKTMGSVLKEGAGAVLDKAISGLGSLVGLSTGGYVKEQGVAMLHPNEVVVNSDLTKKLGDFLNGRVNTSSPSPTQTNNDQRVVFEQGAIVFNIQGGVPDTNKLEQMAEQLMDIIKRKQQLNNFATRTI